MSTGEPRSQRAREPYATVDEVCEYFCVSKQTIYNWRNFGVGPKATKIGGQLRFAWADVEEFVRSKTGEANAEVIVGQHAPPDPATHLPAMVPDLTEEDFAKADAIIDAAGRATINAELIDQRTEAAIAFHRRRLATLDNIIEQGEVSKFKGVRRAAEALLVERDHLAVLLEAADRREAPDV